MNEQPLTADSVAEEIGLAGTSMWLPMNTASVTAAYTVSGHDRIILADATGGAFTVTLPDATLRKNQQPISVKRMNAGGNAVTVGAVAGTIDGAATQAIAAQYTVLTFISDGAVWHIV